MNTPDDYPIDFSTADSFNAAVAARVVHHLQHTGVPDDLQERLCILYAQYFDSMILKFAAGQLEHGGDIRDRDLKRERLQEIWDLGNYEIAELALDPTVSIKVDLFNTPTT